MMNQALLRIQFADNFMTLIESSLRKPITTTKLHEIMATINIMATLITDKQSLLDFQDNLDWSVAKLMGVFDGQQRNQEGIR